MSSSRPPRQPRPSHPTRLRAGGVRRPGATVLVAGLLLLASCSGGGTSPAASPTPVVDDDQRLSDVRDAREVVAATVPAMEARTELLAAAAGGLRDGTRVAPDDRAAAIERLAAAIAEPSPTPPALAGEGPDVTAARVALEALASAVAAAERGANEELEVQRRLLEVDEALADLAATWDEPGSRSQLLERLDSTAEQAEALADDLAGEEDVLACLGTFERRAEAARVVAERSLELRAEASSRDGLGFDALRDEWRDDPFGLGAPLADVPPDEVACWQADAPVRAAVPAADEALAALQRALTPADLSGP